MSLSSCLLDKSGSALARSDSTSLILAIDLRTCRRAPCSNTQQNTLYPLTHQCEADCTWHFLPLCPVEHALCVEVVSLLEQHPPGRVDVWHRVRVCAACNTMCNTWMGHDDALQTMHVPEFVQVLKRLEAQLCSLPCPTCDMPPDAAALAMNRHRTAFDGFHRVF